MDAGEMSRRRDVHERALSGAIREIWFAGA
jgi:hypothetical protein